MPAPTLLERVVKLLQATLIIWLVLTSYIAFAWTDWFPDAVDPFAKSVFTNTHLFITIAVTMFAIGLMLPRDEVRQVKSRWEMVLAGTAIQYATMPALAFLFAKLAGLEGSYLTGVVMVGCVPGAMASNVLTLNAGGNTSYSVSLTTTATILSPIAVPIAMGLLLSASGEIDRGKLIDASKTLMLIVVLPVIAGYLIGQLQSEATQKVVKQIGSLIANLVILLIIAVVVGRTRGSLANYRFDLLWVLLLVNLGGYLAGYCGGWALRAPESMRRALTLEIGMQNAGLGATLALALFDDPQVAIAPAMYTFGCMLTGTILSAVWSFMPIAEITNDETPNDEKSPKSK